MKVEQSAVTLQSQHQSSTLHTLDVSVRSWRGNQRPDFEGQRRREPAEAGVRLSLSALAQALAQAPARPQAAPAAAEAPQALDETDDQARNDPRLRLLIDLVEALTGRVVRIFDARELQSHETAPAAPATAPATPASAPANAPLGWGLEIDSHERVVESERTQVRTEGVVQTADGRQISFTLQLDMSRSFVQESSVSLRAGDAVRKDPLVINFNGSAAALTDTRFQFDLDADGQTENIAQLAAGSGFIALDKNGDGRINDGSELFGGRSGDGFADLAQYDQDGNQWIDEGDAVYQQLQVWQRDASGQDSLSSLAQNRVGALYLGRVASPFSINNASNQTLGLVRSSGVFLYESGQAGSLQQVDL